MEISNCTECGNPADAPKEQQSAEYPICAACLSKWWITDPLEIATEISTDPELRKILNPAAVSLGKIKTEKKAKAARENGKLGGRPKKTTLLKEHPPL